LRCSPGCEISAAGRRGPCKQLEKHSIWRQVKVDKILKRLSVLLGVYRFVNFGHKIFFQFFTILWSFYRFFQTFFLLTTLFQIFTLINYIDAKLYLIFSKIDDFFCPLPIQANLLSVTNIFSLKISFLFYMQKIREFY